MSKSMLGPYGMGTEALSALSRRFKTIGDQLTPAGHPGASQLLTKITEEMQHVEKLYGQIKEEEKQVAMEFMLVARHVDEILTEIKSANDHNQDLLPAAQLQSRLEKVHDVINSMISKLVKGIGKFSTANSNLPEFPGTTSTSSSSRKIPVGPDMSHLKLVISYLDDQMKHCLFCLSIFPENQPIKKRMLIHWWVGEGIIATASEGNNVFENLCNEGLIIPIRQERCVEVHCCKVQPWIRKQLIAVAASSCFLEVDSEGNPSEKHSRTHRAFLRKGQSLTGSNQEVLTLYNVDEQFLEIDRSWFAKKEPKISTIQLGRWQKSDDYHIEVTDSSFTKSIGTCKKLKYLSLRGISRIESLPNSIRKLEDLVVLDLRACHNLETIPEDIKFLKNLEYLDVSECYLLEEMPPGLENLGKLEVLKGFIIASPRRRNPGRLGELTKLNKLGTLSISTGQEWAHAANEFQMIGQLNALRSLTITWGVIIPKKKNDLSTVDGTNSEATLAWPVTTPITFPSGLQKLDLRCFPFESFQNFISPCNLNQLKKFYIRGGMLQTLGDEVWVVEVLRIKFLKKLVYNWDNFRHNFPEVRLLEMHMCPLLVGWHCDNNGMWRKTNSELLSIPTADHAANSSRIAELVD